MQKKQRAVVGAVGLTCLILLFMFIASGSGKWSTDSSRTQVSSDWLVIMDANFGLTEFDLKIGLGSHGQIPGVGSGVHKYSVN